MVVPDRRAATIPSARSRARCCDTPRLGQPDGVGQLTDRGFPSGGQPAEDHQPVFGPQRAQQRGGLPGLAGQGVGIGGAERRAVAGGHGAVRLTVI